MIIIMFWQHFLSFEEISFAIHFKGRECFLALFRDLLETFVDVIAQCNSQ